VLAAAKHDEQVVESGTLDKMQGNFTRALLKALRKDSELFKELGRNWVQLSELGEWIYNEVQKSNKNQHVQYGWVSKKYEEIQGEIVFICPGTRLEQPLKTQIPTPHHELQSPQPQHLHRQSYEQIARGEQINPVKRASILRDVLFGIKETRIVNDHPHTVWFFPEVELLGDNADLEKTEPMAEKKTSRRTPFFLQIACPECQQEWRGKIMNGERFLVSRLTDWSSQ